jgi:thiol-disulfide isomerase/thioredoxin
MDHEGAPTSCHDRNEESSIIAPQVPHLANPLHAGQTSGSHGDVDSHCRTEQTAGNSAITPFEGQVTFATLDVETQPQTPSRYGIGTLPALLFFKDGQVVDELIGVEDKADIAAKLHALMQNRQT